MRQPAAAAQLRPPAAFARNRKISPIVCRLFGIARRRHGDAGRAAAIDGRPHGVDRVKGVLRNDDFVARFGGDEFAVLQHNVSDVATAERLARRICSAVAAPYRIDGNEIHISASIGISPYAPNIASPEVMMIQADLALYRAKEHGRNCLRFHSADLDREVEERVTITEDLRGAIGRGEIELHFQPQVALATGKSSGWKR